MRRIAIALIVLVLSASVAPAAVGQSSGKAYAGTHVSFDTSAQAVTDYAVDGETMFESVKVQSKNEVENGGLVEAGASLSAVTNVEGAGLQLGAKSETRASVESKSGANLTAHDNGRGILVVESSDRAQYVVANLSADANASAESDSQVSVTTANGTEGTFLVVGDGNVTVNDEGDVSARIGQDGRLVFRSYPEGKDDGDEQQETLIADGDAKAEAYVMAQNGETVVDTVSYDSNTTVETKQTAENEVTFAVNRTTHEGTVLITSVSESVLNASNGLNVTVDGEAAVEAATHSQLQSAIGSERSRYMITERSDASADANASTDVLVAVNHFSERSVSMTSDQTTDDGSTGDETTNAEETTGDETTAGDETSESTTNDEKNTGSIPGFTATAAIVALLGAALLTRMR